MADEALGDLIETLGAIDHREIDWRNVRRASYLIHQHFRYAYPGPIANLRQRLVIVPPDFHEDQRLITQKLRVSGWDVEIERSVDTFGNVVLDFTLAEVERGVDFSAWIVVEREATVDGSNRPELLPPDRRLLEPTRLTEADEALAAVAAELRATGAAGADLVERVSDRVHGHLAYGRGTTVQSTAAEAWAGGVGVCQDYAQCMLALCRLCGLPARYVSGHLLGEGGTHAWVEVLLPHPDDPEALRAVPIDPTHDRPADLRYITVAVGRDYLDVAPTSGTYEGPYAGELTAHKRAAVTNVEHLRPPRRRRVPVRHGVDA